MEEWEKLHGSKRESSISKQRLEADQIRDDCGVPKLDVSCKLFTFFVGGNGRKCPINLWCTSRLLWTSTVSEVSLFFFSF